MPRLPLELYEAIVDEVEDQADLLRLLVVSLDFNSAAERRLYRSISICDIPARPEHILKREWSVFERIATCPRVAAHVFHLTIEIDESPLLLADNVLGKVLLSVPNLKALHIFASDDFQHFQTQVPFLLDYFSCSGSQPHNPFTRTIETFLESQVELKGLEFDCELKLRPSALPKLTTIAGTSKFILSILPGRPVTRLTVRGKELGSPPFFEACSIRSLRLVLNNLKYYTAFFPTLTFLEYVTSTYDIAAIDPFFGGLSALKKLKIVVVAGRSRQNANLEGMPIERLNLIQSAFAACPALCYIETCDDYNFEFPNKTNSLIWTRDSQTGIASFAEDEEWKRW